VSAGHFKKKYLKKRAESSALRRKQSAHRRGSNPEKMHGSNGWQANGGKRTHESQHERETEKRGAPIEDA